MGKKSKKFDIEALIHNGILKEGDTLCFVSDPSKTCRIVKGPTGEYKLSSKPEEFKTVHQVATDWLGTEPPIHASKWVRTVKGSILFDLWQASTQDEAA